MKYERKLCFSNIKREGKAPDRGVTLLFVWPWFKG
jgi:hypothetical protein